MIRVDRGGGWNSNDPARVRASCRIAIAVASRGGNLGVRCAWAFRRSV